MKIRSRDESSVNLDLNPKGKAKGKAKLESKLESMPRQLGLDLEPAKPRTHGGKREGAGRPKSKDRHDPPHRARARHVGRFPEHVVLRVVRDMPRLRSDLVYEAVAGALEKIAARIAFRVVHVSLQHNHIHLLVEANDADAFDSGMRALAISLARRINRALGRKGKVFAYRYHSTPLRSPTQTRHALAYVLNNWRRHNEDERQLEDRFAKLDRYSSAIRFAGWANFQLAVWPDGYVGLPVTPAQTWLLAVGWERGGKPIRTDEVPGPLRN